MKARMAWFLLCLCVPTVAVSAAPLADKLPADALVYVGWSGRSLIFDGSLFGQLINEPAVKKIMGAIVQASLKNVTDERDSQALAHVWPAAEIAWQHPIAVSLLDVPTEDLPAAPAAAILIDLEGDREAFAKHLDKMLESIPATFTRSQESFSGANYTRLTAPDGTEMALGYVGSVFFFTCGDGSAERLLQVSANRSLAANKQFANAMHQVGGENEQVSFYIDAAALVGRIEKLLPNRSSSTAPSATKRPGDSRFRRIVSVLGLEKISVIAGCSRIVDRGMYTKTRIFTPTPHKGLLMPLAGVAIADTDLSGVPQDAQYLAVLSFSPEGAFTEFKRILAEIHPQAGRLLESQLARVKEQVGVSIEDDILANLGNTLVVAGAASLGGSMAGTFLSVEVRDAEKLSAAIEKIVASVNNAKQPVLRSRSATEGGATTQEDRGPGQRFPRPRRTSLRIETAATERGGKIHYLSSFGTGVRVPIAPAWAVHKDKLYVALWPQIIQSAIEGPPRRPITDNSAFRLARSRLTGKPSVLAYVDSPRIVRQSYPSALLLWNIACNRLPGMTDTPMKAEWLLPLWKLEKYFQPEISGAWADTNGITIESYGSLPISALTVVPAVGASVLLPSLHSARNRAKKAVSAANLSGIGKGILLYQAEHDDTSPPDLAALVEDGQPPRLLVSPLSGRKKPKLVDGKLVGEIDYIYIRLPGNAPSDLIMAYERLENYRGKGTNVLCADTHVKWMTRARFDRQLKRTKDWLKAHPVKAAKQPAGGAF